MNSTLLLADASSAFQPIFLALVFLVFWMFFIRPQKKKQKEQDTFVEEMTKGTQVVTTGGIIGKISSINDNIITIAVDNKTQIKVLKSSISLEYTKSISTNQE